MQEMKSYHSLNEKSMKCRSVEIKRPHQCGLVAYHLAKLKMTEFYCDVLDTYIQRKFFESITTETFYVAASEKLDDNVKEKMKDEYLNNKSKHLVCNAFDGLFE